jgi:uncharacterized membrane protein YebE (DUF533 family)
MLRAMFSATRLLGGLMGNGLGRTARTAFGGGGMLGTAAKVAGVAAAGGVAYGAYRHYQAGGFGQGGPGLFGGDRAAGPGGGAAPGGFAGAGAAAGGMPPGASPPAFTNAAGAGFGGGGGGGGSAAGFGTGVPAPPQQQAAATPQAPQSQPTSAEEEQAMLLVRAMIAAANVDGVIDAAERQRILQGAANAGFGPDEKQALERELAAPHPPNVLLGQVRSPELAAQFYLVTLLATDMDSDVEKTYVRALPVVLSMPETKVAEIHQQLGVPRI